MEDLELFIKIVFPIAIIIFGIIGNITALIIFNRKSLTKNIGPKRTSTWIFLSVKNLKKSDKIEKIDFLSNKKLLFNSLIF